MKRKRIGINTLHIRWGVNAGTETYLTNIVKPWYDKPACGNDFTLFCNEEPPWWQGERAHFRMQLFPFGGSLVGRILLEQFILPLSWYRRMDVMYFPGYVGSLYSATPQVITVHDGYAWKFPDEIGKLRGLYWKFLIPRTVRSAAKVIAVSASTAADLITFCNVTEHDVVVVHEAGTHLTNLQPRQEIMQALELTPRDYYLCVGFFKEIKNPWRILEAYRLYRQKNPVDPKKLVLAGGSNDRAGQKIRDAALGQPGVVIAARVDDRELAALYRNSAGLIFVSLWEGFGIPILEAQSLGCPVITSAVSSMPEVAGDGAIVADPMSPAAISDAMLRLEDEQTVKDLIERGFRNFGSFSWEEASQRTLEILNEA